MALVLVKRVFFAERAGGVFELRLADPAPILVPGVLGAPETPGITLRCVADEARLLDAMPVHSPDCLIRIVSARAACGVAEVTLILIQVVFFAERAGGVFELRLADPAPVLVPGMLGAPETPGVAFRCVADEAGLARVMRVRNLRDFLLPAVAG